MSGGRGGQGAGRTSPGVRGSVHTMRPGVSVGSSGEEGDGDGGGGGEKGGRKNERWREVGTHGARQRGQTQRGRDTVAVAESDSSVAGRGVRREQARGRQAGEARRGATKGGRPNEATCRVVKDTKVIAIGGASGSRRFSAIDVGGGRAEATGGNAASATANKTRPDTASTRGRAGRACALTRELQGGWGVLLVQVVEWDYKEKREQHQAQPSFVDQAERPGRGQAGRRA